MELNEKSMRVTCASRRMTWHYSSFKSGLVTRSAVSSSPSLAELSCPGPGEKLLHLFQSFPLRLRQQPQKEEATDQGYPHVQVESALIGVLL